jgi:hypothetical protein
MFSRPINRNSFEETTDDDYMEQRMKRSLEASDGENNATSVDAGPSLAVGNTSSNETQSHHDTGYEAAMVFNKKEIVLTNLKHFQEYSIEVNIMNIVHQILTSLSFKCARLF